MPLVLSALARRKGFACEAMGNLASVVHGCQRAKIPA